MPFLNRIFGPKAPDPNQAMQPLYRAIVAKGREVHWYEEGQVADSLNGRFDMISSILAMVLLRMERDPTLAQPAAWLTEIFVTDMDAQMREAGIGDVVIAKDMGKVMGVLGGRIGAYRDALGDQRRLEEAIGRNIHGGRDVAISAKNHMVQGFTAFWEKLQMTDADRVRSGQIP